MPEVANDFRQWCIVEIMGHQTYAGLVTEETVAGAAFVRVDVPETPGEPEEPPVPAFTKLFSAGAVYCLTPVSEEVCRAAQRRQRAQPLKIYMPELHPPRETRRALSARRDEWDNWDGEQPIATLDDDREE